MLAASNGSWERPLRSCQGWAINSFAGWRVMNPDFMFLKPKLLLSRMGYLYLILFPSLSFQDEVNFSSGRAFSVTFSSWVWKWKFSLEKMDTHRKVGNTDHLNSYHQKIILVLAPLWKEKLHLVFFLLYLFQILINLLMNLHTEMTAMIAGLIFYSDPFGFLFSLFCLASASTFLHIITTLMILMIFSLCSYARTCT